MVLGMQVFTETSPHGDSFMTRFRMLMTIMVCDVDA
jgi:hypothetical protein